jgi:heme/copper-type cytochrome/quinol oxidase subunit 4
MKNDKPRWSYIIQVLVISVLLAAVPFWIHGVSLQYASLVAVVILWTAAALVGFHLWKSKRDKREP